MDTNRTSSEITPPRPKPKHSLRHRIGRSIRARMISGVLVLVPLVITWFVVKFLYSTIIEQIVPLVRRVVGPLPNYAIPPLAIVLVVVLIYVVGSLTRHVIGRKLIGIGEAILRRIPIVKTVYSGSKQVVDIFRMQESGSFKRVAAFEYPRKGLLALGFVTGELKGLDGSDYLCIFVPTTPNPTSGFLELVPARDATILDMPIEEGIRMIVSGGILSTDQIRPLEIDSK